MSDKRYLGNIITSTPTAPAGPYQDGAAPGVWSLQEAFTYTKAGLWPIAGNVAPIGLFGLGNDNLIGIDKILIASGGNATDFGDLTVSGDIRSACASTTRGIFGNAYTGAHSNVLAYVTIATEGNAQDFGDLIGSEWRVACSSSTRGLFAGGTDNVIQYITIASTGNGTDFGDITNKRFALSACASPTRGVFGGGFYFESPLGLRNVMDYVTIASTGNALDFGDLTSAREGLSACSSSTRGVFGGGDNGAFTNILDYITIASTGNATDFGDLTTARESSGACSSPVRGVWGSGNSSLGNVNIIDYITIATTGNAVDFGDMTVNTAEIGGLSNAHGGLA